MKKRWIIGGILLAVTAIISAQYLTKAKEYTNNETKQESKVELPILIAGGDASWENCMNEVAVDYMNIHPDVNVTIKVADNRDNIDYPESLIIEEALGNFHGIVEMRNEESYQKAGKLAPISDIIIKQMKQTNAQEGVVYSVPRYYSCRGIIYNKKVFEEMNLKIPQTWQEFLDLCKKIKGQDIYPLTIGAGDLWHLDHWANGLFTNEVKQNQQNWIQLRNESAVHWTDDEPTKMLTDFQELFTNEWVESRYSVTTDAETIEMLTEGHAAMIFSGTWLFSQILKADPQFELGWFFLPNDTSEPLVELNGAWEWAITESTQEDGTYDTAMDFLEFYYSQDVYPGVLQNMNGFSATKQDFEYDTIDVQKELGKIVVERGVIEKNTLGTGLTPNGFGTLLYRNMLRLAQGTQDVSETTKILDEEWNQCLENNQ